MDELDKGIHKGHEEQGIDNIKGGVSIGDLTRNIAFRRYDHDDLDKPLHENHEDNTADNIKHHMGYGYATGCEIGS